MKVLLEAPILTKSGYGEHARLVYRALKENPQADIYIRCLGWGRTAWMSEYEDEMHECILKEVQYSESNKREKKNPTYDVQVFVGILNEFEKKAPHSVVVTAGIETDRVSADWLMKTYQGVQKIIVPSEHAKSGFRTTSYQFRNDATGESGTLECQAPIDVVPYPVKDIEVLDMDLKLETEFNFLNVALLGPRKNIENSIEWFLEEFKNEENVGLILKTARSRSSLMDRRETISHISSITARHPDAKCKVYLLHGNMTEQELHSLYHHPKIKALVTATCGEGYGLPIFEAAYSGLPVLATDWSGHLDFLSAPYKENGKVKEKKLFAKVAYTLGKINDKIVWNGVLVKDSNWAYASPPSYKAQLRKVFQNYGMYKKWSAALQQHVLQTHSAEKIKKQMHDSILGDAIPVQAIDLSGDSDGAFIL